MAGNSAKIKLMEATTSAFVGQSDLIIFDEITDYSSAAFQDLANPVSLGQVVADSTAPTGDDPETNTIKDEQGDIITSKVTGGTLGLEWELASSSQAMLIKFMCGNNIDLTGQTNAAFAAVANVKATGIGTELPVMTRPLMLVSDDRTKAWLYPKAKIVSNLTYTDGLWRIHCTSSFEYVKTATLSTAMLLEATTGDLVVYDEENPVYTEPDSGDNT